MTFELTDNVDPAFSVRWQGGLHYGDRDPVPVYEGHKYTLTVAGADPSVSYRIRVGEEILSSGSKAFGSTVLFESDAYFESGFGRTEFSVWNFDQVAPSELSRMVFYVIPTKISTLNHNRMVDDLRRLCNALALDIVGKSKLSCVTLSFAREHLSRSHEEELVAIKSLLSGFMPLVAEIKRSPSSKVVFQRRYASVGRNRTVRGVVAMMKRGIDPLGGEQGRKCKSERLVESVDLPEHRLVKSFLLLLLTRLRKCRFGIENDIGRLRSEKRFRHRIGLQGEVSLYESEDVPKIRKLQSYYSEVEDVESCLSEELGGRFWLGVREHMFSPTGIQFTGNGYYRRIENIILHYLRDGYNWGGISGADFMVKKTSKMYEQWVLVQLVSAFERQGIQMTTWDHVIEKCLSSQFGLDFKTNTIFCGSLNERYCLVIRYQPWILPYKMAKDYPDETLCHFGSEDSFWSPDIVIEMRETSSLGRTIYAIAVDAKYTRHPSEKMRSSVLKYQKIRSCKGRSDQAVRQVWMVYTGNADEDDVIKLEDEALLFSPRCGIMYRACDDVFSISEQTVGSIVVKPGCDEYPGMPEEHLSIVPMKVFEDFSAGTLAYFRAVANTNDSMR